MLRSMYAGISGMKNMQTKLDVIGNNIANVNTFGYKKGRVTFNDLVSQEISGASAPGADRGGTNPKQVGLGSSVGSIDTIDTQGNLQTTDRPLDVAISSDGYFTVRDGNHDYFTRAGNFYLDQNGDLTTSQGMYVLGVGGDPINLPEDEGATDFSIGNDGTVRYSDDAGDSQTAGQIGIVTFANPGGLEKAGNNLFEQTTNSGGASAPAAPGTGGTSPIEVGMLEMSNVDLSEEFTDMITAQRAFQANTKIITTSDEVLQELVNLKR